VRRKPGGLVQLEVAICTCVADLRARGVPECHGYAIARALGDESGGRLLTAYGTLYRALGRLEQMGLLRSHWEDPAIAARESRPGRRLYTLTAAGEAAVREMRAAATERGPRRLRGRPAPA
jgi:PadR family transcriptional regulator, regulatory protein PadR